MFIQPQGPSATGIWLGTYDGYGTLMGDTGHRVRMNEGRVEPCVYHEACWRALSSPSYTGPSKPAGDQGHFVGDYDPPEPKTPEDVKKIRKTRK